MCIERATKLLQAPASSFEKWGSTKVHVSVATHSKGDGASQVVSKTPQRVASVL